MSLGPETTAARPALDVGFVTPQLAIGARLPPDGAAALVRDLGVTRVIDVRGEARDDEEALVRLGGRLLHLPTDDLHPIGPSAIETGVRWALDAIASRHRVLIHCEHGIGRSALLTACVLVASGRSPVEALRSCKDGRPCVSPSPAQLEALLAFASSRSLRRPVVAPTFDELAAIAYAHLPRP